MTYLVAKSCPECGALYIKGNDCRSMLEAVLAWEWEDPELQAEHFQTVACYNLQHPAQFSKEALLALKAALLDYIERGISSVEIRKRMSKIYEGSKKVLKKESEQKIDLHTWAMSISDVYASGNPNGAAERVKKWGTIIRKELLEEYPCQSIDM